MKMKRSLQHLAILLGIFGAVFVGYELGSLSTIFTLSRSKYDVFGFPTLPPLAKVDVPSQTVDGITATLESAYADPRRVVFIMRLSSNVGNYQSTETFLTDARGNGISLSRFIVGLIPDETSTYLVEFNLADPLDEARLDGQLFLAFASPTDGGHLIQFHFDFDLPIHPFLTFNPKKTISIDGVDMLLDRVMIAPAHTFLYLCYPNGTQENWIITGEDVVLNINGQNAALSSYEWFFDSAVEDGSKGGEPSWAPLNQESRCVKFGFPIGDANPRSPALTIPGLENAMTTTVPENELSAAYEKLIPQGIDMKYSAGPDGTFIEYKTLPEGMTEKDAYRKFLDALGYVRKGPWTFRLGFFYFLVH